MVMSKSKRKRGKVSLSFRCHHCHQNKTQVWKCSGKVTIKYSKVCANSYCNDCLKRSYNFEEKELENPDPAWICLCCRNLCLDKPCRERREEEDEETAFEKLAAEKDAVLKREEDYKATIKSLKEELQGYKDANSTFEDGLKLEKEARMVLQKDMDVLQKKLQKLLEEDAFLRTQIINLQDDLKTATDSAKDEACKQRDDAVEHRLQELIASEFAKVKEAFTGSSTVPVYCDKSSILEETTQRDQILVLERELADAHQRLKVQSELEYKLHEAEKQHFAAEVLRKELQEKYDTVLKEKRNLYMEIQDMKGKVRVYCRVRPFLGGENQSEMTIRYFGDEELVITSPSKRSSHRFKFNKVFGPASTLDEVYADTRPLIQSVAEGYHVCIFAYGQTGSGKTHTMNGINDCALRDLFRLCDERKEVEYEILIQVYEIYNDRMRDLLPRDKKEIILDKMNSAGRRRAQQPGMHHVTSTDQVLELMQRGYTRRAKAPTALNQSSSRSHSFLTVHVHGRDRETNGVLHGRLLLVDLAGSERVFNSQVEGETLKEAGYINKSLSALGNVMNALVRNTHVPYDDTKLTRALKSSLEGQAKTVMFVHVNPTSFSETKSSLEFGQRVSGVQLGAAQRNKEGGKGPQELMEQVTALKDALTKKDKEIARLRLNDNDLEANRGLGDGDSDVSDVSDDGASHFSETETPHPEKSGYTVNKLSRLRL